jgi:hypothetical protein
VTGPYLRCRICDQPTTEPIIHWAASHFARGVPSMATVWEQYTLIIGTYGTPVYDPAELPDNQTSLFGPETE